MRPLRDHRRPDSEFSDGLVFEAWGAGRVGTFAATRFGDVVVPSGQSRLAFHHVDWI
jgi:hypothetical protein